MSNIKEKIDFLIKKLINERLEQNQYKDFKGNLLKLGDKVIIGGTLTDQPQMRVFDLRRYLNKIGTVIEMPTENDKLFTVKFSNSNIEKFNRNYLEKVVLPIDENKRMPISLMFGMKKVIKRINEEDKKEISGDKVAENLLTYNYVELYSNDKDGFTVEFINNKGKVVKIDFEKDEYPEAVNLFNERLRFSGHKLMYDYVTDDLEYDDLSEM